VYGKGERPVGFGVGSGVGSTEGNGVDSVIVSVGRSLCEVDMGGEVSAGSAAVTAALFRTGKVVAWSLGIGSERCWGPSGGKESEPGTCANVYPLLPVHLS